MEAAGFSDTLVPIYENCGDHIPRPHPATHIDFDNYDSSEFTVHECSGKKDCQYKVE
jgi:hypothetical protein